MAELTYREAVAAGIAQEMRRNDNVVFLGEDIGGKGHLSQSVGGQLRHAIFVAID